MSLSGTSRSLYARMCASEPGIDPYTRAVSDVYQDLFGEGSFIGKGIYEVDAFERALGGRFPDNRILSHDLLEGCYARAGLLSDVQLYEEYPSRYSADVSRRHRWIRGDWQIARWVRPWIPDPEARLQKNPLSMLSRWKILDNLRRSLIAAALTLLLLLGWTVLPAAWFWTLAVIGIILIPSLITSALNVLQKPGDVTLGQHLAAAVRSAGRHFVQAGFTLVCLPYEAFFSLDAMVRTVWRMLITHKRLLEWNPSGDPDRNSRTDLVGSCRTMWIAPVLAVGATITLAASKPAALAVAGPILGLWFASPAIAWWISRPLAQREARLTADQTLFLRKISRKTWAFFETFVGPDDHWLPPDNYQEHPVAVVAHRTSPTNMGLALLANLSAYDFGYISAGQLIERTAKTLHTMEALERHRGHFYNWYDTQSLKPLLPLYISSVDSGNLAGHLLTLRPGLLALADHKILGTRLFEGLSDTLGILADAAAAAPACALTMLREDPLRRFALGLAQLQQDLESAIRSQPTTLRRVRGCASSRLATSAEAMVAGVEALDTDPESPLRWWAHAFAGQCRDALDELTFLAPWTELLSSQSSFGDFPELDEIPTLRELATLEGKLLPAIEPIGSTLPSRRRKALGLVNFNASSQRPAGTPEQGWRTIKGLALQCDALARMEYDFLYDETASSAGYRLQRQRTPAGLPVTTIFWLRKRDFPLSWRSRRDNCRRRAGSLWDDCSPPPAESRSSFRGAVRCSNT